MEGQVPPSSMKRLIPTQAQAMEFVNNYHDQTIKNKRAVRNENGSVTTVNATGVEYNGLIYTVPGYDNRTGFILEGEHNLLKRWGDDIRAGNIVGIPKNARDPESGEHYANIYASQNHERLDGEAAQKQALEAIRYDNYVPFRQRLIQRGKLQLDPNDPMMGETYTDMYDRLKKDVGGAEPMMPAYASEALDNEIARDKRLLGSIQSRPRNNEELRIDETIQDRLENLLKYKNGN